MVHYKMNFQLDLNSLIDQINPMIIYLNYIDWIDLEIVEHMLIIRNESLSLTTHILIDKGRILLTYDTNTKLLYTQIQNYIYTKFKKILLSNLSNLITC